MIKILLLKFILEVSNNNSINFLDVSIIIDNNKITFFFITNRLIRGDILIFIHTILLSTKKVIYGLTDRIVSLSHPKYFQKNFEKIIQVLLDNNYPLNFIFNNTNIRLKKLFNRFDKTKDESNDN